TGIALARVARHRDPIVSYATRERVRLRTASDSKRAHALMLEAARAAWHDASNANGSGTGHDIDGDGKVEGPQLDRARAILEKLYKHDEAYAFDLWASPRRSPHVLVLYFEGRRGHMPIWVALRDGVELHLPTDLPKGAFAEMRHAADGMSVSV